MEKQIKDSIEKIMHLSYDYRTRRNVSPLTLLKESGYVELHRQINEEEIAAMLNLHPHLVNEWLVWSENKRTGERVWTFSKFEDGGYLVGYSTQSKESEEINTTDEFKACAAFIKREAEALRKFV